VEDADEVAEELADVEVVADRRSVEVPGADRAR
jgi:hypothetical protein